MKRQYYVTIKVEGRYVAFVEADSVEEARYLARVEFDTANLDEMEVVDSEDIIVEDEDRIIWER